MTEDIVVSGNFDNIGSRHVRFLEEAAKLGDVHVYLWSDQAVKTITGIDPKFPEAERKYLLESLRFVHRVWIADQISDTDELPHITKFEPKVWVVFEDEDTPRKRGYCASHGIIFKTLKESALKGFPVSVVPNNNSVLPNKKVLVTGCFDWFHSGHVRFFEETARLGDLYVVVGHDENVRLLKGEGHPLFPAEERCYMAGAVRFVKQALISTGNGWMDAEPEIESIKPDIYAVNEDGDQPEKREFCEKHRLEYVVLKRVPAPGLPRRESTHLRGF
jgi:cytidyltransferase-like protein